MNRLRPRANREAAGGVVDRSITCHAHSSVPRGGDDCRTGNVEDAFAEATEPAAAGENRRRSGRACRR
jgi:hypothetical protein